MRKLIARDVSVDKLFPSGAYLCAAMVDGHRAAIVYYFSTKREAIRAFVAWINATQGT